MSLTGKQRLAGKTAIITGGGSGFGAAIVKRFADEGATVWVADINMDSAEKSMHAALKGKREGEVIVTPFQVDVSKNDSVRAMMKAFVNAHDGPDILVNNAGITHERAPMEDVSEADFDRVMAVNVKSVYLTARHFVPAMKTRGTGVILNISSTAGISPRAYLNWYNASKGWMITATKTMAVELADSGIRVNAICPVAGDTPLLKTFLGGDTPENRQKFLDTIPLGRFSTPEDHANAALYLCSDEASMVTGVALEVDGGRCI